MVDNPKATEFPKTPMLDRLKEKEIVTVERSPRDPSVIEVATACYDYVYDDLTPDEVRQLGQEIIAIANALK